MLIILVAAVVLLIWNGSSFFRHLAIDGRIGTEIQVAGTALFLNVALLLFGWRRYVDLQHEAELRADGERRAAVLATTDPHTGLLNRKGFADRVQALAGRALEADHQLVVLSVQIHRFKVVNDRHGYEVGDTLLRAISDAITEQLPSECVVARLSADEFAIALTAPLHRVHEAEELAASVLRLIGKPYVISNQLIQVGAFAGIASAPADEIRVADLQRRADIALDHAKSGRTARPIWFDTGMEKALIAHSELEQGMRVGLENEQFVPYFEPQVNLETGEIVGFEVLARWTHPLSGIIGPDTFIPVAEEIGLIDRLSQQIIRAALAEAAHWDERLKISVNISPSQLADGLLAERLMRLIEETGFAPERLVIEITESSLFADIDMARSIVTALKSHGIRLALDDFGTGFSSLAHLRSLPFDMIKIDRSFLANIHSNRESLAIIRAVSTLANALGVPVCIEGIEDEMARAAVLRLGCEVAQGWYFGKPMPAEQAAELVRSLTAATNRASLPPATAFG